MDVDLVDRDGNEIGELEWCRLFSDRNYRTVNTTQIGNIKVSTVWLGIRDLGAFETMLFGGHSNGQWRWATEWNAMEGHGSIVALVEDGQMPVPPGLNEADDN